MSFVVSLNMMRAACVFLLVLYCSYGSSSRCAFRNKGVILLQELGDSTVLLPYKSNVTVKPYQQNLLALCPENNQKIVINEQNYNGPVTLTCVDGSVTARTDRNVVTFMSIGCSNSKAEVCRRPVKGCSKTSYNLQISVKGVPVVFADICYDVEKMEAQFVHYIMANRSPLLKNQVKYNPGWTNNTCQPRLEQSVDHYVDESNKHEQLKSLLGEISEAVDYETASLIPKDVFAQNFPEPNTGSLTSIFWWKALKNGNWRLYEAVLRQKSKEVDLDVYAGTSHTVTHTYSPNRDCNSTVQLKLDTNYGDKSLALYVWNYVRLRNSNDTAELVIIGVNSPLLQTEDTEYRKICTDICDTVDWLDRLKHTRKAPALGYVFCCDPSEVKDKLDGFPQYTDPLQQPGGSVL